MTDPKDWKEIQRRIRMAITTLSILLEEMNTTHPQPAPKREEKPVEDDELVGNLTPKEEATAPWVNVKPEDEWAYAPLNGIHQ